MIIETIKQVSSTIIKLGESFVSPTINCWRIRTPGNSLSEEDFCVLTYILKMYCIINNDDSLIDILEEFQTAMDKRKLFARIMISICEHIWFHQDAYMIFGVRCIYNSGGTLFDESGSLIQELTPSGYIYYNEKLLVDCF